MSDKISLREAERKVFQSSFNDGLWDILLGGFVTMFAIAPLLSASLGDFWSSAIFLPIWGVLYLAIWLTRKLVISPRIGTVSFGKVRKNKLRKFTWLMLAFNGIVFIFGCLVALNLIRIPGWGMTSLFGLMLLAGFSLAAYLLDFPRLYLYGLLLFVAAPIGEWLRTEFGATHHGYPIVYGVASGVMILTGLVAFVLFLKDNPVIPIPADGAPNERTGA